MVNAFHVYLGEHVLHNEHFLRIKSILTLYLRESASHWANKVD